MENSQEAYPVRCVLSFKPLMNYLNQSKVISGPSSIFGLNEINAMMGSAPELMNPIEDLSILDKHADVVKRLMGIIFPPIYWESEAIAAVLPYSMKPVFVSPLFQRLFLGSKETFIGRRNVDEKSFNQGRAIRAYLFILEKFYGIRHNFDFPLLHIVPDIETGLDRYFKIRFDFRFVDVHALREPKKLTPEENALIHKNITEPDVLKQIITTEDFELRGLTIFHAVDVTESEMLSKLERDLVGQGSIVGRSNFLQLQENLRTLFRRPELEVGLNVVKNDKILQIDNFCEDKNCCIYTDTLHVPLSTYNGTIFQEALCKKDVLMVPDITKENLFHQDPNSHLIRHSRSLLVAPLHYEGICIGLLNIGSPRPEDFGPMDVLLLNHILPFFSMAVKKALNDLDNRIQGIIKEKCTAIHPTVEWRFRQAAFRHLENQRKGYVSEIEPIVFKDVYPLYGTSDIRGSAIERNRAIQKDLTDHLTLALTVIDSAIEARPMMILQQLSKQIRQHLERIRKSPGTGDEIQIVKFLRDKVETIFPVLKDISLKVIHAIEKYEAAMDPKMGMVYQFRKDFEESVSIINHRLSTYLDKENEQAQKIFPHLFERHQTDGLDYLIYLGDALVEKDNFSSLFLENLRLWQLKVACGMAWHTEQLKSRLKISLETSHLILVQDSPISIRFRYDEKRFDVDGAYDMRQEIIKSRIDKALIKESQERLTQPGKIAVVYSNPEEAVQMHRHIDFLKSEGFLCGKTQTLDLEALPGIENLKALRMDVDLKSSLLAETLQSSAA